MGSNIKLVTKIKRTKVKEKLKKELHQLPLLKDCDEKNREDLLIQKLEQCCVIFDFPEGEEQQPEKSEDQEWKIIKSVALNELVEILRTRQKPGDTPIITRPIYEKAIKMFTVNSFRDLPPEKIDGLDIQGLNAHLQLVYKFFLCFLEASDFEESKKFIDEKFLFNLLEMFNSEDPDERRFLKIILYRIYEKLDGELKVFIRNEVNNIFYRLIYRGVKGIFFSFMKINFLIFRGSISSAYFLFLTKKLLNLGTFVNFFICLISCLNCAVSLVFGLKMEHFF